MIRHAGLCEPVRDAAVLADLSAILGALHAHFVSTRHLTPADRRAVDRACSRLWSQVARGALASGAMGLGQAARLAPAGFRWRYGKPFHLLHAWLQPDSG